ncbi:phage major capsid protein [Dysgonomonas sp. 520]|uniref:phage major capsid protein n=1 Tax=Dysgonomonas sp. 520 TaxID=2302931 RepID=UPI0013D5616A|nr:phage major capsid protein [Dysgonomonas sp. 520]NDW10065.1 hypothetical protein [Dysgonomonas sp. 520]
MAVILDNVTYQPTRQPDFFTKLMFSNKTSEHVNIIPNVKYKTLLNTSSIEDDLLQFDGLGTCGWTPSGDVKFSERELEVKPYKVNFEQCLAEFEKSWIGEIMKPGANLDELPSEVEDQIMYLVQKKIGKEIEAKIWNGVASATDIDGFITVLDNATDTIKVAGVALTKANILGEFEKIFLAQSEDVIDASEDGELKFYVSKKAEKLIKLALADTNNSNIVINQNWLNTGDSISYMGYEVVALSGIPSDVMVFANWHNLAYGTDLISDETELRTGMFPQPEDDKYFVKGRLKLGVQVAFPDEVVLYK